MFFPTSPNPAFALNPAYLLRELLNHLQVKIGLISSTVLHIPAMCCFIDQAECGLEEQSETTNIMEHNSEMYEA